jgi:hypothetical protein
MYLLISCANVVANKDYEDLVKDEKRLPGMMRCMEKLRLACFELVKQFTSRQLISYFGKVGFESL